MEKFLYFANAAGANGALEAGVYPVSMFKFAEPVSATLMNMYFKQPKLNTNDDADGTTGTFAIVALTIGDGDFKAVMTSIIDAINEPVSRDGGIITVFDGNNSIALNAKITAVELETAGANDDVTD
jgi:hypothetical protein